MIKIVFGTTKVGIQSPNLNYFYGRDENIFEAMP